MAHGKKNSAEEPSDKDIAAAHFTGRYSNGTLYLYMDNEEAIARQTKGKHMGGIANIFGRKAVPPVHLGTNIQRALRQGAIDAFHDGNPEKIQYILRCPNKFAIREGIVDTFASKEYNVRENVLTELIKGSKNPGADINIALKNVYKDRKNYNILNDLLYFAFVTDHSPDKEKLILAILDAAEAVKHDIGK